MAEQKEREQFEKVYGSRPRDDRYSTVSMLLSDGDKWEMLWQAWQASRASALREAANALLAHGEGQAESVILALLGETEERD